MKLLSLMFICGGLYAQEPTISVVVSNQTATVTVTNGNPHRDYVIEHSVNMSSWTPASPVFETDTNGCSLFLLPATNHCDHFRLKDVTLVVQAMPYEWYGSMDCGEFAGIANYYSAPGGSWGYVPIPGLSRYLAIDTATNNIVTYLGWMYDHGCSTNILTVVCGASDPEGYRFSVLFAAPPALEPHRIILKGFRE